MTLDTTTALDELEMAAWEMMSLDDRVLRKSPVSASKLREFFNIDGAVPYLPALRPLFFHSKIIFLMHTLQLAFGGGAVECDNGNIEVKMCPKTTAQILHISPGTQSVLRRFFKDQGLFDSKYSRKEGVFVLTLNPCLFQEFMHRACVQISRAKMQEKPPVPPKEPALASKPSGMPKVLEVVLSSIQKPEIKDPLPGTLPGHATPSKDPQNAKTHMTSQDWDTFTNDIPWGDKSDYAQFL